MNKAIMMKMGFGKEINAISEGKCPLCNKLIVMEDFRDDLSKKQFKISGLCQSCQDSIFGY